jgi:hypothetical protein
MRIPPGRRLDAEVSLESIMSEPAHSASRMEHVRDFIN